MRCLRWLWFFLLLVSIPFIWHYAALVLNAENHAWENKRTEKWLQDKAAFVEEYRQKNGEFPKPCVLNDRCDREVYLVSWSLEVGEDGTYTLHYNKPRAMFGGFGSRGSDKFWLNTSTGEYSHSSRSSFAVVLLIYLLYLSISLLPTTLFLLTFRKPKNPSVDK